MGTLTRETGRWEWGAGGKRQRPAGTERETDRQRELRETDRERELRDRERERRERGGGAGSKKNVRAEIEVTRIV